MLYFILVQFILIQFAPKLLRQTDTQEQKSGFWVFLSNLFTTTPISKTLLYVVLLSSISNILDQYYSVNIGSLLQKFLFHTHIFSICIHSFITRNDFSNDQDVIQESNEPKETVEPKDIMTSKIDGLKDKSKDIAIE